MLELEHGFRVVDVHVELEPDEQLRSGEAGDPERLEREFHQAGIVRALVVPGDRDGSYLKVNNAVARLSVGRPFDALARVNGVRDPRRGPSSRLRNMAVSRKEHHTSPDDIEQYAYDDRFAGFKLHPGRDGLPDEEVLEELETVDLPVMVHGGRQFPPDVIEDTLLTYDFPLVISHFGGYPLDDSLMNRTIDLLDSHDRCYLDTSAVHHREPIERAVMEQPGRVLFASGAPAVHPNVAIMEILTLDVPEDAMRKVFSKNPARVFDELG